MRHSARSRLSRPVSGVPSIVFFRLPVVLGRDGERRTRSDFRFLAMGGSKKGRGLDWGGSRGVTVPDTVGEVIGRSRQHGYSVGQRSRRMNSPEDALPFVVVVDGPFAPEDVVISVEESARPTTPRLESLIAEEWERQTALASRDGRRLFNGSLLRYVRHENVIDEFGQKRLRLRVGPTCYRDFVGTNLFNHHRLGEFTGEQFANPIGTTATIVTADGYLCYGRRSSSVAYHGGHVHTLGGALEAGDLAANQQTVDALAAVLRELREEVGFESEDLVQAYCTGMIRDKEIRQPEMLFDVYTGLSTAELNRRWLRAEAKDEHVALVTCPDRPGAISPFIRQCGAIAPVAVGAMFLHGRRLWGKEWYREAAVQYPPPAANDG
jgi:hypothetical protein